MPNWAEGNIRLRGKPENIMAFLNDLISRKAAIETVKKLLYETALNSCGHHQDDEIYADIAENRIEVWLGLVPSVPAVPLDKLCEWLARNAFAFECKDCEEYCRALLECENEVGSDPKYWKNKLTKWMEELDGNE